MHSCFYLITTCFLVLPRMCETTKIHFEYVGLLDWNWQDLPFLAIDLPVMPGAELPVLGLVKTCKDEDAIRRLKIWFQRIHFVLVIFTHELQLPVSDSGYRIRNEMLDCWESPALVVPQGLHCNCCPSFSGLTPLPFDLNVEGHFICSAFQLLSATY